MTLGARQTICLAAADIGFRKGCEVVPVKARGHVRVSSDYGISGYRGQGQLLTDRATHSNNMIFDTKVDIFMTHYSRSYFEVGESCMRHIRD